MNKKTVAAFSLVGLLVCSFLFVGFYVSGEDSKQTCFNDAEIFDKGFDERPIRYCYEGNNLDEDLKITKIMTPRERLNG